MKFEICNPLEAPAQVLLDLLAAAVGKEPAGLGLGVAATDAASQVVIPPREAVAFQRFEPGLRSLAAGGRQQQDCGDQEQWSRGEHGAASSNGSALRVLGR